MKIQFLIINCTVVCTASTSTDPRNTRNATIYYNIIENRGNTYAKMVITKMANNFSSM